MKQSNRSFDIKAANPVGRRRRGMQLGQSGKKLTVIISAVLAVLMLAASGIYAWFSAEKQYIEGQIDIGTMEVGIHVFTYDSGTLVELDGADNEAHTGQSSASSEGVIVHDNWGADSAGVRYIAIENRGTIDVKSYLTLQGLLGPAMNENSLDYFHFLITPLSELTGSNYVSELSGYAAGYTQMEANAIVSDSANFRLTNIYKSTKIGEINHNSVSYYRLDYCCYNLPTEYVPQQTSADTYVKINASVSVRQKNAPEPGSDEGASGNNTYVDSATAFVEAVRAAANNDTIFLMQDITVDDSITILQRVNINLNGHTLTVTGNLAYDCASAGYCQLVITGSSRLYVWGDLLIDMPNTRFELLGGGSISEYSSATASIILGHYNAATDSVQGGRFYVNCMRDPNHVEYGYTQTAAQVWKWINEASCTLADMEVGSNTGVKINANSVTGVIRSEAAAHDISIYNFGEIMQIDLTTMYTSGGGSEQIYIVNYNKFTNMGTGENAAVIMPAWAIGHLTGAQANPARAYNARAINAAGAITGWHVTSREGSGYTDSEHGWFRDQDIESGFAGGSQVIRNGQGDYTVILVNDTDSVQALLAAYFAGEGSSYQHEWASMSRLTIVTYEDGNVKPADFQYIRANLTSIAYLNLSNAIIQGGLIPSYAMQGVSSLTELVLPISEIAIGDHAFDGTSIEFLTISNNVTSIGAYAFSVAEGANIYITWDSTVPVDNTILQGFAMNRTTIFMYEYLLDDFRANYPAYAYHAYEHYDFFEEQSNGFYKILSGGNAQLIYYCGALNNGIAIPVPATAADGDTTYTVTVLGEHCFRLSISENSSAVMTLTMPASIKTIEEGAFYAVKLTTLQLTNVSSIGREAFASAKFEYCEARPSSFTGMTYLGEYAFGSATMGKTSNTINESTIGSAPDSGELDLSGAYSPADNALNTFKIWRGTLKLEGLDTISASVATNMQFYGSTLYVDNCDTIMNGAFNGRFHLAGRAYNNLYARNVKNIGGNAFALAKLNEAYVGLEANMYSDQGSCTIDCQYGVVPGAASVCIFGNGSSATNNTVITVLNVNGWIPESANSDNKSALLGGNNNIYDTVNINYPGEKLPDYMFYTASGSFKIIQLNISQNVTAIGAFTFYNATINNTTLDMSLMTNLGVSAFQKAKLNYLTDIELAAGAVIGDDCFNAANLSSITSIDLENISSIGARAFFQIIGGGITSINVSGVDTIGMRAFADIKNNSDCIVAEIDITSATNVGANAFGGLNVALAKVGSVNDGATYGASLFGFANTNNTIGELRIMGTLPAVNKQFSGDTTSLLTYNSVVVTSACSAIPNQCFALDNLTIGSTYSKGIIINSFTSEGNISVGSFAFKNVALGSNMDFTKVTSVAAQGFNTIYILQNSFWAFDSLTELTTNAPFANITGADLAISFLSITKIQSSNCFDGSTAIKKLTFGSLLGMLSATNAFINNPNLTSITMNCSYPPTLASTTFSGIPNPGYGQEGGLTIYVPAEYYYQYEQHYQWTTLCSAGYVMGIGSVMTSTDGDYSFIVTDRDNNWAAVQKFNGSGTSVSIPSSIDGYTVKEISGGAFEGTNLTAVTIPASVVYIDPAAFTSSHISDVSINGTNTNYSASNGVIYNKTGDVLVYYCGAKTDTVFTVPADVTTIASGAFGDAGYLRTLYINSSVNVIDGNAFGSGCGVTTYNFNSTTPPVLLSGNVFGIQRTIERDGSIVYYNSIGAVTINIPDGSYSDYANGFNWHPYVQVLNEDAGLTGSVAPVEIRRSGSFGYVLNDNGLAVITEYYGMSGVVQIPAAVIMGSGVEVPVAEIAPEAFNGVYVTAFAVSEYNEYFSVDEYGVLYSKDGRTLVRYPAASSETGYEVPETVTRIEAYAFAGAENLETVYIPSAALRNMGEMVFEGCSDKLALYGGAAANPFAAEIPEAILPEEQGRDEDEDMPDDDEGDSGSGDDGDDGGSDGGEGEGGDDDGLAARR